MTRRNFTKHALSFILAASLLTASLAPLAQDKFISIATGGTAGIYFPLGGALAKLWTDQIPGVQVTAEVTGASVENTRLVVADEAQVALGTGNVVYEAYAGGGRFEKRGKQPILAISAVYPNAIQIATLAGTGIKALQDMVGKRVSIGAPGSGTEAMNKDVFNAVGRAPDRLRTPRMPRSRHRLERTPPQATSPRLFFLLSCGANASRVG